MNTKEIELVAIMFADIAGYTALMQQSESNAKMLLDTFQSIADKVVPKYNGQIVNSYGDGFLAKFFSAESALNAAKEMQTHFLKNESKVPVRIGLHLGDVFLKDGNIYGNNVNLASRIESFAVPGSILFSEEIYSQISNKDEFKIKDLGSVKFKNDSKDRTIFALIDDNVITPNRTDLKGKGSLKTKNEIKYLLVVFFLAALALVYLTSQKSTSFSSQHLNTIAVLPLINLSQSQENFDYFSDGLTTEIIDELSKIGVFEITPFTQSNFYKNSNKSPRDIANELGVTNIISGSIRILPEEKIKLSIELFDPFANKRLWNKSFESNLSEAQKLQSNIANDIAQSLNIKLSPKEKSQLALINTVDGEAFRLLLKAKSEMDKFTNQGFIKARELLDDALEKDSSYAQAYTLKAWNILLKADPQIIPTSARGKKELEHGKLMLKKSIQLRPDFSDSYLVRSSYKLYAENNILDAINDVELAIELKSWPKVPTNYCTCAMVSAMVSGHRFERASEIIEIAEEIDPANILQVWDKGIFELAQGNLIKAEELFRNAYNEAQQDYFRVYLALALFHLERYQDVINLYPEVGSLDENITSLSLAYLSNAYFRIGELTKSDEILNKLNDRTYKGNTNLYKSIVYAGREDLDLSMKYFVNAYETQEIGTAVMSSVDPIFNHLKAYPRFQEIRNEMQFPKVL